MIPRLRRSVTKRRLRSEYRISSSSVVELTGLTRKASAPNERQWVIGATMSWDDSMHTAVAPPKVVRSDGSTAARRREYIQRTRLQGRQGWERHTVICIAAAGQQVVEEDEVEASLVVLLRSLPLAHHAANGQRTGCGI